MRKLFITLACLLGLATVASGQEAVTDVLTRTSLGIGNTCTAYTSTFESGAVFDSNTNWAAMYESPENFLLAQGRYVYCTQSAGMVSKVEYKLYSYVTNKNNGGKAPLLGGQLSVYGRTVEEGPFTTDNITSSHLLGQSAIVNNSDVQTYTGTVTPGENDEYAYVAFTGANSKALFVAELKVTWTNTVPPTQVMNPVISPAGGNYINPTEVKITCATPGASIYYTTDGSEPTAESTLYTAPFTVSRSTTVKAIAMAEGLDDSEVVSAAFNFGVAAPVITPAAGTYYGAQTVAISCESTTASVYYTTDGSTPTEESTLYTAPFSVSTSCTVKAIAMSDGSEPSTVTEAAYTIVTPKPVFTPAPGEYTKAQNVTISCDDANATIYYTTDGTEPTAESTVYSEPIAVASGEMTIKAMAVTEGMEPSETVTGKYQIVKFIWNYANDVLNNSTLGVTSTAADFEKTLVSKALWCGNLKNLTTIAATAGAMQFIANSGGIYSAESGGTVGTIKFDLMASYNTSTANGGTKVNKVSNTIKVYGRTAEEGPFTSVAQLYGAEPGTLIATVSNPSDATGSWTATVTPEGSYAYVAFATETSTSMVNSIDVQWKIKPAVSTPVINPESGTYLESQTVTISCDTEDATIYYTTDGTEPTAESTVYTEPFTIDVSKTVKAIAMNEDLAPSQVAVAEYVIERPATWTMVTDATTLATGDRIIIVAADHDVAMATTQNTANREQADVTRSTAGTAIFNPTDDVQVITLYPTYEGSTEWLLYAPEEGYLTAVAGKNYLVSEPNATDAAYAGISTDANEATITFAAANRVLQYNDLSSVFATYAAGSQCGVQLFRADHSADPTWLPMPLFAERPGTYDSFELTITCADADAAIYYTKDGSEPTAESSLYTGPVSMRKDHVIKAVAIKGDYVSAVNTGVYYINGSDGIEGVLDDSTCAPVYYNLQGIRVERPTAPGVYIIRQGSKATKVVF